MVCLHIQRKLPFACASLRYGCTWETLPFTVRILYPLSVFSPYCVVAMWLTALLLGARWTPGKQWIGKHRRVLKMTGTRRRNQAERDAQIKRVGSRECRATTGDVCTSVLAFLCTIATCAQQIYCIMGWSLASRLQKDLQLAALQYTGFKGQNGSHAFLSCLKHASVFS